MPAKPAQQIYGCHALDACDPPVSSVLQVQEVSYWAMAAMGSLRPNAVAASACLMGIGQRPSAWTVQ